jgi:tetraacyldisaccharide 4'-kinase
MVFSPSDFRDLVSGRRRGPGAAALRGLLRVAETPYAWALRRRNRRYDTGAAPVHRVAVPVVSVGNLTLGGTGKTPLVHWLVRWFLDHGIAPGVVSRGYGARAGEMNDEAKELALHLPGIPHVQDPDRVAGAQKAIEEFGCQVLVLDDAFQHRRIGRDLDIVLLDALEPLGFGHVFPRGTLREPLEGIARADVLALSRADMLRGAGTGVRPHCTKPQSSETGCRTGIQGKLETCLTLTANDIRRKVERYNRHAAWLELAHVPRSLVNASRAEQALESLADRRVAAFCGIGNPAGFWHTLAQCGYELAGVREFPDHHRYGPQDVDSLTTWARSLNVAAVVCTQKDLVKLGVDRLGEIPLWAVAIRLEVLVGREALESRLIALAMPSQA